MAPPKAGRRGELVPSLALLRDTPYRGEHDASVRATTPPPQTWAACVAWFRAAWEASLPTRMHTAGVEADSALGSPRMAGAMHARTDHVSERGWGVTGWDRDGQPRGVTSDGLTRDPFLFHLETMLRSRGPEAIGAAAVVRWAYMGWDADEAAHTEFTKRIRLHVSDPDGWELYRQGFAALIERTIRMLWYRCRTEPVRWSICRDCRRRECVCGERSEAQVNAEEEGLRDGSTMDAA